MTTPPPGQYPQNPPPGWDPSGPGQPQPGGYPAQPQQGGYPGQPQQGGYPGEPQPGGFPPPPPPSNGGRNALILGGSLLVVLILVVGLFVVLRGGSDDSSSTAGSTQSAPAGTATGDVGGDVSVDVEVGGCIKLGGTLQDATADPEPCGSEDANYKVIGKAPNEAACVSDVDAAYYETKVFGTSEAGALCLDVDWVEGDCFSLPVTDDDDPTRISCASATSDDVVVRQTLQGTIDDSACDEGGIVYDARMFVVCLGTPTAS